MPDAELSTTVRFSVFVDPDNADRALVSIAQSDVGASEWQSVALTALIRPLNWEYAKLLYVLSKPNEDPHNTTAEQVGKNLYDVFFAGQAGGLFRNARTAAVAARKRIRLAIDSPEELVGIPWELLHDDNDFLLRQDCSIVRVARELAPGQAYFGPITSIGLVAVTPDFDARDHIRDLTTALNKLGVATMVCADPNRRSLVDFLARHPMDALYFFGHGEHGRILLRPDGHDPGWFDGGDLAACLPEQNAGHQLKLVYLSSCGTAECRPEQGVFSGVAQRLMLSGRVGTVIAMQAKIGLDQAQMLAEWFFEAVVTSGDPERALLSARTAVSSIWGRSTPVLYTHVNGPAEFRKNRISRLLGALPTDRVCISLAGFVMGLKRQTYQAIKEKLLEVVADRYNYRGGTYAQTDVDAAKELLDLLTQIGDLSNVTIADDDALPDCRTAFIFGSASHHLTTPLNREFASLRTEFAELEWKIIDAEHERTYVLPSPARAQSNYPDQEDWGFIEKTFRNKRCYFFICGLGDRATRGCAYYLARNWELLLATHKDAPFVEVLRFPGGLDHTQGTRIDRATGADIDR